VVDKSVASSISDTKSAIDLTDVANFETKAERKDSGNVAESSMFCQERRLLDSISTNI
jgi:hypothetical protein